MPNSVLNHQGEWVPVTYTVQEIDNLFGFMPVSQFGDTSSDPIPVTISDTVVTIGPVPAFFNGKYYHIAASDVTMITTVSSARWLYLVLTDGVLGYSLLDNYSSSESPTCMFVGTIHTDTAGVVTTQLEKVTRLGNNRLSTVQRAGSIPVSTGNPADSGDYAWPTT